MYWRLVSDGVLIRELRWGEESMRAGSSEEIFVGWVAIDRCVHRSHTQWVGLSQNIDLRSVGLSMGKQNIEKISERRVGQSVLDHYRLSYRNVGIISPIQSKLDLKVSMECARSNRLSYLGQALRSNTHGLDPTHDQARRNRASSRNHQQLTSNRRSRCKWANPRTHARLIDIGQ
jgi:hypothetical protein